MFPSNNNFSSNVPFNLFKKKMPSSKRVPFNQILKKIGKKKYNDHQ